MPRPVVEKLDRDEKLNVPWYSARLLYESVLSDESDRVYEDRIIVITAADEDAARTKAAELGRAGEQRYNNAYGELVQWKLLELLQLCQLFDPEIVDGSEVYVAFLNDAALSHVRQSLDFKFDD